MNFGNSILHGSQNVPLTSITTNWLFLFAISICLLYSSWNQNQQKRNNSMDFFVITLIILHNWLDNLIILKRNWNVKNIKGNKNTFQKYCKVSTRTIFKFWFEEQLNPFIWLNQSFLFLYILKLWYEQQPAFTNNLLQGKVYLPLGVDNRTLF